VDDFFRLDATAQAELVRSRQVSPAELVEAAIARIERFNPALNAVVTPMYEEARRVIDAGMPDGPFAGVPFLLKDLGAPYAGVPSTSGSRYLKDFVPGEDSELVKRYKRAGLVTLGKTNTPEFGLLPVTEGRLFGAARNPWDPSRTPGGSSGGAAAAVAARMVPVAHGNDGGGSIRIPSSCCSLFGLKPGRGRMPGSYAVASFLGIAHVLSVSVRDSAALLDATAGQIPGAPFSLPPPQGSFLEATRQAPGRLRIAFSTQSVSGDSFHPDCIAAVQDVAALCESLGHEVVEAAPQIDGERFTQAFDTVWFAQLASNLELAARTVGRAPTEDDLEPLTWFCYQAGKQLSATQYLGALDAFASFTGTAAKFFAGYDLWLTPTIGMPPPELGFFDATKESPERLNRKAYEFVPVTPLFNLTGQPAMSVPLYWNDAGLPIGTHFAARAGEEATLLRLASQLEQTRPWADRLPPLLTA
jgi:amidase